MNTELEYVKKQNPDRLEKVIQTIKDFATFSEILRLLGAVFMVASMSVFMLKGWTQGDDVGRYLKLLTQTGLLAAGGLILTYVLKENKGARTFFGLSLISIPANFAILGALFYSISLGGAAVQGIPKFASWGIQDPSTIIIAAIGAMIVLIPVALIGTRIFARQSATQLGSVFLVTNAILFIPIREPLAVGAMIIIAMMLPLWVVLKRIKQDPTLATIGGKFIITLLFAPALILLTRNLYLYHWDSVLGLVVFTGLYIVCRQLSVNANNQGSIPQILLETLTVPLAYAVAFTAADSLSFFNDSAASSAIFSTTLGVFMLDYATHTTRPGSQPLVLTTTAIVIALTMLMNAVIINTSTTAILGVVTGLSLIGIGIYVRQKTILVIGILTAIIATVFGFQDIFTLLIQSSWLGLAVIGGLAIVIASLVDRYGPTLKLKLNAWSNKR